MHSGAGEMAQQLNANSTAYVVLKEDLCAIPNTHMSDQNNVTLVKTKQTKHFHHREMNDFL